MTRALIADPDLVAQGRGAGERRDHRLHRLQPGLHRPLPRRRADRVRRQPAHGARAHAAAAGPARAGRCACSSSAAGRPGVAAALEAAAHGDAVTLSSGRRSAGQLRLAGRAPAHRELWRRWRANAARPLGAPG